MSDPARPVAGRSVTYLTAGAAGMFCGSCMHDNALAKALTDAGWPTTLVPAYTPIRTDETDATVDQVFFGGINVFLQQKIPFFRYLPGFLDRFLDNPRLIKRVTSRAIETNPVMLGELTVSMLKGEQGKLKKEVRRLIHWIEDVAKPDVLILTNILIAGFIPALKHHFDVPVVVTLQGDDIFLESLTEPWKSNALEQIRQLDPYIDAYLVHSEFYADAMANYLGVNREHMHVTPLGLDTRDFEAAAAGQTPQKSQQRDGKRRIGYLARMTRDKGLHNVVEAFVELKQRPGAEDVRLELAGWLGSDHEAFCQEQFQKLESAGLGDQFHYHGSVSRQEKLDFLQLIDVLCVPTEYLEPKGLYVLEAMASGVPVVQPAHGAFSEIIHASKGGVLYPPNDSAALVDALCQMLDDPALAEELGERGRAFVLRQRNATTMAQDTIRVLETAMAAHHG